MSHAIQKLFNLGYTVLKGVFCAKSTLWRFITRVRHKSEPAFSTSPSLKALLISENKFLFFTFKSIKQTLSQSIQTMAPLLGYWNIRGVSLIFVLP